MPTISKTELFRACIDRGRKDRTAKILKRFGFTPGEAMNVFFAKVEEVGSLPFDPRPEPDETKELMANPEFLKALERMKSGKTRYVPLDAIPD